ncbi:DNA primase family protein [Tsuneonella sp. HG222]
MKVAPDPERDLTCARLPLTDMGNAERWRVRFGGDFRFCPELGWFAWDQRRWKLLSEEKDQVPAAVTWSIARTVRAIRNEASLVAASGFEPMLGLSDREAAEVERWSEAHGTANRQAYLQGLARDLPELEDEVAAWIAALDPLDQLLDLKKGKLWSGYIEAHAKKSESAGSVAAIVKWIKGFPDIVVRPDQFDADRMAINVLNGTLRIERNKVKRSSEEVAAGKSVWKVDGWRIRRHPHDRADLITKLAPVKFTPAAQCPAYDAFIARVQPDETMRRFIHQWGGLSLTGDIGEQKLAFFYGGGSNGKGTWVEAVAHLAGDYAGSIPIESFLENGTKRRGDQATPDIARLPGVRFLRVSEPEKGAALNEGLIKMVTGGDPVDARHLNKGFFTFLPSFKMTISGNHKPKVKDTSDGIWRRMQLVPWAVNIPAEERDRTLGDKLQAEASGILNRLIEGLLDWREHGLIEPDEVRMATRAYRDASDELGRFLSALCEVGEDPLACRVRSSELFDYYTAWCEAAGGSFWKAKGFVAAMEDKGFERKTSNGVWWLRVQLRPELSIEDVKRGVWPEGGSGAAEWPDDGTDPAPDDEVPGW